MNYEQFYKKFSSDDKEIMLLLAEKPYTALELEDRMLTSRNNILSKLKRLLKNGKIIKKRFNRQMYYGLELNSRIKMETERISVLK